MKILKYKKIEASFHPWSEIYLDVAQRVIESVRTEQFDVIHIGSTSFKVGGKGIIDLSVLYKNNDLDEAVKHLLALGFQDQISENPFPPERPRKDGTIIFNGKEYFLHLHVIQSGSDEHTKQIEYKKYMLNNLLAREAYESTKKKILSHGYTDQENYGKQKSPYVKSVLNAIIK
ncbi:MAG: GrpB family protein [Candidatus Marinarcus sp.]|uniref:GrpB family protein n=1 Tax=Candidatus Marinarcus sp. TaxID=3100987 RepID=UPI003B00E86F